MTQIQPRNSLHAAATRRLRKGIYTAGADPEKTFTGSNSKASEASRKNEGGPGVLPREIFCDHALQIGLKRYFGKRFFDHALEVNTLKVVSYDSKLNNFRAEVT